MSLPCFGKAVKWLLIVNNLMFFIIGMVTVGLALWLFLILGKFLSTLILLIVGGGVVAMIGLLGCLAACNESKTLLTFFSSALLLVLIVELVGGTLTYVYRDRLERTLHDHMTHSMSEYDNSHPVRMAWDFLQEKLDCCGVTNQTDWAVYGGEGFSDDNGLPLAPHSCCNDSHCPYSEKISLKTSLGASNNNRVSSLEVWDGVGCYLKIREEIENRLPVVFGCLVGLVFFQLMTAVFACVLAQMTESES